MLLEKRRDEKIQKCAGNLTQFSGDFVLRVSGDSILAHLGRFDMAVNDMYYSCTRTLQYIHIHLYKCLIEILAQLPEFFRKISSKTNSVKPFQIRHT